MKLKKSLTIALVITIIATVAWEGYWRSQGYYPNLDDNDALWAQNRHKLKGLTKDGVVLLGSSRVLFDIQLDEWEEATGIRPVQLATAGSTPLPIFHDLVENTSFNGTVLVGVTPGLFFSTTFPKAQPWAWAQTRVDHYHKRTYAQRLNHSLSIPLQNSFAFLSESEMASGIKLKTLLSKIKIGERGGKGMPPFYDFADIEIDRNVKMTERTATDTAFANTVKRVWQFYMNADMPPPDKKSTMAFFLKDAKKFMERGGNLILLRCPSTGFFKDLESKGLPREAYWDSLVSQSKAKAYNYMDYPQFTKLECPEWSHLSAEDASYFTKELVSIMLKDGTITNQKTN